MQSKEDATEAVNIALAYVDEQYELARKHGLVVGSCYQTQAHAALEIAERISKAAGLPKPTATLTHGGTRCHWGGTR